MDHNSIIKRVRILEVIVETEHARTLVLEPLDGWKPQYKAGQFLTLVFKTVYGEKRRSFSLISQPETDKYLRITVKKVDNGEFSRPLVYGSTAGDIFLCSGISGLFVLPENIQKKTFCFLAAGSGITPCFALINTLLKNSNSKLVLFYSNTSSENAIFYEALKNLQADHPDRMKIRFLFSNHHDLFYKRMSKWLLDQLLMEYLGDQLEKTLFYLCGPFDYMQMAGIVLLNHAPKEHIIKENFNSLPRILLPEPPDKNMYTVTIRIEGQVHKLNVQYPKSILRTAIENKIELPYSCQAGRCASCIATCTKGNVWLAYNEVLVDKEIEKGRILTCQGFPVGGDVEIIFDSHL